MPWKRAWQPTPVLLAGEAHGQRSLAGSSPRGRRELDTTERLSTLIHMCSPPERPPPPPSPSSPLHGDRAPACTSWVTQQIPTGWLFHVCLCVLLRSTNVMAIDYDVCCTSLKGMERWMCPSPSPHFSKPEPAQLASRGWDTSHPWSSGLFSNTSFGSNFWVNEELMFSTPKLPSLCTRQCHFVSICCEMRPKRENNVYVTKSGSIWWTHAFCVLNDIFANNKVNKVPLDPRGLGFASLINTDLWSKLKMNESSV